ncbi:MAG: hypothetical protein DME18_07135 [Verrucomicrobia bacterium]|nr:MAG: hypothetical protein DME18_07135 [Verrucomicrobiota bacterium]
MLMNMTASDLELLQQYARRDSEEAFAALVSRHLDLVYSVALRQVRSPQLAEEVAQSVFADLARNIHKLKPDTILTAWLYQVTRRTAISVVRRDIWMNRSTYLVFSVALGIGLPLLLIGLGYVVRFLPVNSINIPNRNYWLAPERRVVTFDFLFRHLLWLACFEAIFMIGVHLLIADANRQVPPHLSLPLFWGVFGSGLTFVAIWLGVLLRRFRRDMSGRNCVPLK